MSCTHRQRYVSCHSCGEPLGPARGWRGWESLLAGALILGAAGAAAADWMGARLRAVACGLTVAALMLCAACSVDVTAHGSLFRGAPKVDAVATAAASTKAAETRADAVQTAELLLRVGAAPSVVEELLRDRGWTAAEAAHVVTMARAAQPVSTATPWPEHER